MSPLRFGASFHGISFRSFPRSQQLGSQFSTAHHMKKSTSAVVVPWPPLTNSTRTVFRVASHWATAFCHRHNLTFSCQLARWAHWLCGHLYKANSGTEVETRKGRRIYRELSPSTSVHVTLWPRYNWRRRGRRLFLRKTVGFSILCSVCAVSPNAFCRRAGIPVYLLHKNRNGFSAAVFFEPDHPQSPHPVKEEQLENVQQ